MFKDAFFPTYEERYMVQLKKEVPLDFDLEDTKIKDNNLDKLKSKYEELEFFSFLKNMKVNKENKSIEAKELTNLDDLEKLSYPLAFYI